MLTFVRCLATAAILAVLAQAGLASAAEARSHLCGSGFVQFAASGGDFYSEFVNDGEELNGSYHAAGGISCGAYVAELEVRHSRYVTENAGPGTRTLFCTLDGGFASTPFFTAADTTSDVRLARRIGRSSIGVGVAYLETSTNYGYPHLRGVAYGVEKFVNPRPGLRVYGSFFYSPAASGNYRITQTGSPNNGQTVTSTFSIVLADIGVQWRPRNSPAYLYVGYADEVRDPKGAPLCMLHIRSAQYVGIGVRL